MFNLVTNSRGVLLKFFVVSLCFTTLISASSLADPAAVDVLGKARELSDQGKTADAIQLIQSELQKGASAQAPSLLLFRLAILQYNNKDYEKAITTFDQALKAKTSLDEYAYFYKGMSYFNLKKWTEAKSNFKAVDQMSPNVKLKLDSLSMQGQVALQEGKYKEAKTTFMKIEKRLRGTEQYPDVLYFLALAEQGLGSHRYMCKWVTKLYSRYPDSQRIQDWSFDLVENKINGKATQCESDLDDFKSRVRYLIFAGYDKKAQDEINSLRPGLSKTDPYLADQVQAQYFSQEGELTKAYDLLKPYYEQKRNNFSYLIAFAVVAARAGEVPAAVGSYYAAYKLAPHHRQAKEALYQSAFLSYQFQDYDGAARRFQEFMHVYPKSNLNRDAKWQLAWIRYLKGDYPGAYKAFSLMQNETFRTRRHRVARLPADRLNYWMAMSLYRQGKYDAAKTMLESLAKDSLMGYYAIAAQYRLKKLQTLMPKVAMAQLTSDSLPRRYSRMPSSEYLIPSIDDNALPPEDSGVETEEGIVMKELADDSSDSESTDSSEGTDDKPVDVVDNGDSTGKEQVQNPVWLKRFEKARELLNVGLDEWARWDLYDIEKKTRNKDFMKALMTEYRSVGYYNRSSYIGQVFFSGQRAGNGMEGARSLWEETYPRAYSDSVEKYARDFAVPDELVWGIMRAESQYRKDAISPVGALGLMQVMPFTGYRVANLLGEKEFQPRKLLEADAAIKMGSRYLQRLMAKFDNTIPLVAAGYNAGPHRVKNWLNSFGHLETDEFIEHIPFLETRNYVKKVVANCYVYSQLYGNKKDLFSYLVEPVPYKTSDGSLVQKEAWDDI